MIDLSAATLEKLRTDLALLIDLTNDDLASCGIERVQKALRPKFACLDE